MAKATSRRDAYHKNRESNLVERNDFSVGLEYIITSIILLVTETIDKVHKNISVDGNEIVNTMLGIFFLFVILIGTSLFIRTYGWNKIQQTSSKSVIAFTPKLKLWKGILIPNLIGIFCLLSLIFLI